MLNKKEEARDELEDEQDCGGSQDTAHKEEEEEKEETTEVIPNGRHEERSLSESLDTMAFEKGRHDDNGMQRIGSFMCMPSCRSTAHTLSFRHPLFAFFPLCALPAPFAVEIFRWRWETEGTTSDGAREAFWVKWRGCGGEDIGVWEKR